MSGSWPAAPQRPTWWMPPGASGSAKQNARETAQQTFAAWILILGQLALGLLVTVLFLAPAFKVPIHFGQLLEVSWAGGFGSANAWGEMHKSLGVYRGAGGGHIRFNMARGSMNSAGFTRD